MRNGIIIIIILSFLLLQPFIFLSAQERKTEISYPGTYGLPPIETTEIGVNIYFKYIYYAILSIGGLMGFGILIYAGFRYLTSAGSPAVLKDAKEQAFSALLGMLLLLGSWLILNTISPELIKLKPPLLRPFIDHLAPGIWVCNKSMDNDFMLVWRGDKMFQEKMLDFLRAESEEEKNNLISEMNRISNVISGALKAINERCYLVGGSGTIHPDFVTTSGAYIYSVPRTEFNPETKSLIVKNYYSAVVFSEINFQGLADILWEPISSFVTFEDPQPPSAIKINNFKPRSILTFVINESPARDWKMVAYEEVHFNEGFQSGTKREQEFTPAMFQTQCGDDVFCESNLQFSPKSLRINSADKNSKYVVILSINSTPDNPAIFIDSKTNLLDYSQITKLICAEGTGAATCLKQPAATHVWFISANIY